MNKAELEIFNKIIKLVDDNINHNNYLINDIFKGDKNKATSSVLYHTEYKCLDYLDGRKNLLTIPKYCKDTGDIISKKKIKNEILKFNKNKKSI